MSAGIYFVQVQFGVLGVTVTWWLAQEPSNDYIDNIASDKIAGSG
jgi:hypothetical protein